MKRPLATATPDELERKRTLRGQRRRVMSVEERLAALERELLELRDRIERFEVERAA